MKTGKILFHKKITNVQKLLLILLLLLQLLIITETYIKTFILTKHQFFKNGTILINDPISNSDVRNDVKNYIKEDVETT